jgi:hypothetical protein
MLLQRMTTPVEKPLRLTHLSTHPSAQAIAGHLLVYCTTRRVSHIQCLPSTLNAKLRSLEYPKTTCAKGS